jgi:DNA mismatch endonuclease (patch repair protein)
MAAVRGKNTAPELKVRSILHRLGLRFRLHDRRLPGTPDIVLARHRTVVLVHGCFWHQHRCSRGTFPKSHAGYWQAKLSGNKLRDKSHCRKIRSLGWRVVIVWECQADNTSVSEHRLFRVFGCNLPRAMLDSVTSNARA